MVFSKSMLKAAAAGVALAHSANGNRALLNVNGKLAKTLRKPADQSARDQKASELLQLQLSHVTPLHEVQPHDDAESKSESPEDQGHMLNGQVSDSSLLQNPYPIQNPDLASDNNGLKPILSQRWKKAGRCYNCEHETNASLQLGEDELVPLRA